MRIAVPHRLEKDEVCARLRAHSHEIAELVPGGLANVSTRWETPDRLAISIATLGQQMAAMVDVDVDEVIFTIDLPEALAFVKPLIETAIRDKTTRLLR